jgi:hypothetical protein
VLLALASTGFALGTLELSCRMLLAVRPARTAYVPRTEYRLQHPPAYTTSDYYSRDFLIEAAASVRWLEPLPGKSYYRLGDVSSPHFHVEGNVRHTPDQPPQARQRVWLFGGSTVFCQEVPDEHTLASYLQRLLNQRSAGTWRVENLGTPALTIAQQLDRLRDTTVAPGDVVIFYDGFNDVWQNVYNGYFGEWCPGMQHHGGIRRLTRREQIMQWIYTRYQHRSAAVRLLCNIDGEIIPRKPVEEATLHKNASMVESQFLESLRAADAWCRARNVRFVHILQPHVFALRQPTETERWLADNEMKIFPRLDRAFQIGYPIVRAACRRAVADGIASYDLSAALDDRPETAEVFLDQCHVNEIGNSLIARRLVDRAFPATPGGPIDYSRDIRPILSAKCFSCHGPGAQADAGLPRLDRRDSALGVAIVPGRAADSPLVARISSVDADEQMPPPGAGRSPLSDEQIALLRRWIDEGATYTEHWAFSKPFRPPVPDAGQNRAAANAIDAFIAAEHARRGLTPSPAADPTTLLRRLSFDLVGLPPSPAEVADFVGDPYPDAYERAVDRLLASPRFGERMAVLWLDLVRYADTDGYSKDYHREMPMYRDYVISSFNQNKPFDQFTREQLAGDLLPHPSREKLVGSGYNRLQMTSQEGCADPKEYTHRYAADRVRNVGSVWLGVTLGCAECHDHKFDPFTARDFYRMAALFADVQETAVGPQELTRFSTAAQNAELKRLDARISELDAELTAREARWRESRGDWEKRLRKDPGDAPAVVAEALLVDPEMRNEHHKLALTDYFRATIPEFRPQHEKRLALRAEREALLRTIPSTLVTSSGKRRVVRILPRGNWADESGEIVAPGFPASLSEQDGSGSPPGRLDLANWLTSRDNALVARVFVNRLWKMTFGKGLVATPDDFGVRGAPPTHPELLDWLAVEFVERGWNVKGLLKTILMSNTYRQSSDLRPGHDTHDPDNRYLTRQNRFPLDAEFIRDNALSISGLLTTTIGGRSVKPYQPDGYWAPRFSEKEYRQDHGADLYRRGLYTYWCRNYLHPDLAVFGAPSRQICTADRVPSSTPLQALVLLNDPVYAEAARVLAARIVREGGATVAERANFAMQLGQSRALRPDEESVLTALYRHHRQEFEADREAALAVVETGEFHSPDRKDAVELAAWTSVTKVILNLHETITRR